MLLEEKLSEQVRLTPVKSNENGEMGDIRGKNETYGYKLESD